MADKVEPTRDEKIAEAKEMYSRGSRNYLVKSYNEAADDLSQVCALYEEIYGELSDELGMPYLLYAKSLISIALEENKVLDVPDEEDDEDDDDLDDDEESADKETVATPSGSKGEEVVGSSTVKVNAGELKEADSTEGQEKTTEETKKVGGDDKEAEVTSTEDAATKTNGKSPTADENLPGTSNGHTSTSAAPNAADGSNINEEAAAEEDEIDAATNLQVAWETLELASKIFTRQGLGALPNLAEVQTELANIEFENNILDAAREDYQKALQIYKLLTTNYRRAMAEIHYKIGLTYLMQQLNDDGAESLKEACELIDAEIDDMKAKKDLSDKEKNNIQDMEETKQEIWAKITEIEETKQHNIEKVRAALDSFICPGKKMSTGDPAPSSSSSSSESVAATSSSKPTDISHLIKRKKPDTPPNSEAEAASPSKRPAV